MRENVPRFGAICEDERKSRIKDWHQTSHPVVPLLPAVRTVFGVLSVTSIHKRKTPVDLCFPAFAHDCKSFSDLYSGKGEL
jgi:hypothetical protein